MAHQSFFVQHICGYDARELYEKRATRMRDVGFSKCVSEKGADGKCWEIWYLCDPVCATGELKGKSAKEILSWLMREITPGQIETDTVHYGLGID